MQANESRIYRSNCHIDYFSLFLTPRPQRPHVPMQVTAFLPDPGTRPQRPQ